jgi:hypothetical protein
MLSFFWKSPPKIIKHQRAYLDRSGEAGCEEVSGERRVHRQTLSDT